MQVSYSTDARLRACVRVCRRAPAGSALRSTRRTCTCTRTRACMHARTDWRASTARPGHRYAIGAHGSNSRQYYPHIKHIGRHIDTATLRPRAHAGDTRAQTPRGALLPHTHLFPTTPSDRGRIRTTHCSARSCAHTGSLGADFCLRVAGSGEAPSCRRPTRCPK